MRILFFLESLHCGGKERRSLELIRYLIKESKGYVIELVLTEADICYEDVYETGISIKILKRKGMKYDPTLFSRFYDICHNFKPDLIHSWGRMATFYSIMAKVICRVPLISSLIADSSRSFGSISFYSFLLNTNIYFSDIILSNTHAGLKSYRIRSNKARVVHNGVSLSRFQSNYDHELVRKELSISTRYIIVMVASFSTFKDYDLFVDIAGEMQQMRNDVTFLGVGDGTQWERIRNRVKTENIRNIVLTGSRKDVEQIIASCDIGILCTKKEGMSNSIIEYMALGKPVIATDEEGGSKELIEEGISGFCTGKDTCAIIQLINRLLDDSELRKSMGERGRERIETHFSIGKMGKKFEGIYSEVLSRKYNVQKSLRTSEIDENTFS